MFANIDIERRCRLCGAMIGTDTIMHGSLGGVMFCKGKPVGRSFVRISLQLPHTIKRTGEVVPHPAKWRLPTPAEKAILAPLVDEVRSTGKSIYNRDVRELLKAVTA